MYGLGDVPATADQVAAAGYDPTDPNTTYTVDDAGNVTPTRTVTAPARRPTWPLLVVIGLVGWAVWKAR